ncbi:EpsG family protein [Bacteroides thetaiotaomicron]|nr:EpsG family protein [Bacteroides thetaiotaomicron]
MLTCFCDSLSVKQEQKQGLYYLSFFILALFAGLRCNLPDYGAYEDYFKLLNNKAIIASEVDLAIVASDKGYIVINKIIGVFTNNPIFFISCDGVFKRWNKFVML